MATQEIQVLNTTDIRQLIMGVMLQHVTRLDIEDGKNIKSNSIEILGIIANLSDEQINQIRAEYKNA